MATARRLGLPGSVLQRAEEYLGQGEQDSTALLTRLNEQQRQLEHELAEAGKARWDARQTQLRRKEQLQQLKEQKAEIISRATRKADALIADTESRLKSLRKRQATATTPPQAVADRELLNAAREQLQPFRPQRRRGCAIPAQLEVGELVRVTALGVVAQVERLGSAGVELLVAGKRIRQPLAGLEQFAPRRFASARHSGGQVSRPLVERHFEPKLMLIGKRVDEALPLLERFIDDALLYHLSQVEIIHGTGEGILRRRVRESLAGQPGVSAFYAAPAEQGGENVTIAELGKR
jgi:DNA mismatch repair protein MutS2